jgi:hypothetical protein
MTHNGTVIGTSRCALFFNLICAAMHSTLLVEAIRRLQDGDDQQELLRPRAAAIGNEATPRTTYNLCQSKFKPEQRLCHCLPHLGHEQFRNGTWTTAFCPLVFGRVL